MTSLWVVWRRRLAPDCHPDSRRARCA
jgi:hypothetical protein